MGFASRLIQETKRQTVGSSAQKAMAVVSGLSSANGGRLSGER